MKIGTLHVCTDIVLQESCTVGTLAISIVLDAHRCRAGQGKI